MRIDFKTGTFYLGDCIEVMATLGARNPASVDMVLCDLPYGTTQCSWDAVIPFGPLWSCYWLLLKASGPAVLTANQPFTTLLNISQMENFKYGLVWDKVLPRGHLNAKKQPLRVHEDISVFCRGSHFYEPQKSMGHKRKVAHTKYEKGGDGSQVYGKEVRDTRYDSDERYPTSILTFSNAAQTGKVHPTQKPVSLFEYLIRTYTNPGELVLDNTAGSGTTAIAAIQSGRRWICIERDPDYFNAAIARVFEAEQLALS